MRLRWTQPAARDLTRICDFLQEQGAAIARAVALAIYERVRILSEFPQAGRAGRKQGTRELVLARLPYIAIYRLRGEAVEVLRILHASQNWPQ